MKHLKMFEMLAQDIKNQKLKAGDYILVYSEYHKIDEEPMIIVTNINNDALVCKFINQCELEKENIILYSDDIIRKLEPFEVKSLKYNI